MFILFVGIILGAAITFNTLGLVLGNVIYQEISNPKINANITGIVNTSQDLSQINQFQEQIPNAQRVALFANNTQLVGTYVNNNANKTIILIHGLYQNRSRSLAYVNIYRQQGFNILLIDLRGHGESEGIITWGKSEVSDIDAWCNYLRDTQGQKIIGIQGVSLGGAFSLLHSGLSPKPADFYVEDSSYSDIKSLYYNHLHSLIQLPNNSSLLDILWFYSQVCMYWHTGATLSELSSLEAVKHTQAPILFLHGDADTLIPVNNVDDLYNACTSAKKQEHIFKNSTHAQAITENHDEYVQTITDFLRQNGFAQ